MKYTDASLEPPDACMLLYGGTPPAPSGSAARCGARIAICSQDINSEGFSYYLSATTGATPQRYSLICRALDGCESFIFLDANICAFLHAGATALEAVDPQDDKYIIYDFRCQL